MSVVDEAFKSAVKVTVACVPSIASAETVGADGVLKAAVANVIFVDAVDGFDVEYEALAGEARTLKLYVVPGVSDETTMGEVAPDADVTNVPVEVYAFTM